MKFVAYIVALLSFLTLVPSAIYSQELLNTALSKELTVKVQEQADGGLIVLQSSGRKIAAAEVFGVPDPNRIVIDLPVIPHVKRKTVKFPKSKFAKALRIGTHPDKTRVVLDLVSPAAPLFDSKVGATLVQIKVAVPGDVAAPGVASPPAPATPSVTPPPSPSASPALSPSPSASPLSPLALLSAQRVSSPTPTATQEPAPAPVMTEEPTPPPVGTQEPTPIPAAPSVSLRQERPSRGPELKGLFFEQQPPGNSQVVRIALTDKRQFKLVKNNPRTYRLIVPNCVINDDYLTLPLFPPHYFTGFTYLQANRQKDSAVITIGIEHGARVSAFAQGNDILVQSAARQ